MEHRVALGDPHIDEDDEVRSTFDIVLIGVLIGGCGIELPKCFHLASFSNDLARDTPHPHACVGVFVQDIPVSSLLARRAGHWSAALQVFPGKL